MIPTAPGTRFTSSLAALPISLLDPPAELFAQHLPQFLPLLAASDERIELGEGLGQRWFRRGLVGRQAASDRNERGRQNGQQENSSRSH
jgi:hypothetical protein